MTFLEIPPPLASPQNMARERHTNFWRASGRVLLLPALFLSIALLALTVDCGLSQWFAEQCPAKIKHTLKFFELFGHGLGVVLIAIAIYQLDPGRRWALPRVFIAAFGAGLTADVVKLLVGRIRPYYFNLDSNVLQSFDGWLPFFTVSSRQSFPSAHTATAVALALALIGLYPRGRWLFAVLAVLVGCQRLAGCAHYLSDVFTGAAIGMLIGTFCVHTGPVCRAFDRWESGRRNAARTTPGD